MSKHKLIRNFFLVAMAMSFTSVSWADNAMSNSVETATAEELLPGVWFPVPDGYVRAEKGTKLYDAVNKDITTDGGLKLRACYRREKEDNVFNGYLGVLTPKGFYSETCTQTDFNRYVDALNSRIRNGEVEKALKIAFGSGKVVTNEVGVIIKLCEVSVTPILEDNQNAFSIQETCRMEFMAGAKRLSNYIVIGEHWVFVNGRIFCLMQTKYNVAEQKVRSTGDESVEFLRKWHSSIVDATAKHHGNEKVVEEETKKPVIVNPFDSVFFRVCAITVITAILSLVISQIISGTFKSPIQVRLVVSWLIADCITALGAFVISLPKGSSNAIPVIGTVLLRPLFVWGILRRHKWPRIWICVVGVFSLFGGITERLTTPAGNWNDLAATWTINGIVGLILWALLATKKVEDWRKELSTEEE